MATCLFLVPVLLLVKVIIVVFVDVVVGLFTALILNNLLCRLNF